MLEIGEVIREKALACHLIDEEQGPTMELDAVITEVHEKLTDLKHIADAQWLTYFGART